MRFTAIQIPSHDTRLDDLSPGMNVVFTAAADRRRLLAAAIRSTIFGVATDQLPDCRLSLQTNWGGFHLAYRGDGSVRATDSQGHDRSQWLRQKLATLTTEAAFAAVYTPRWGDPIALDTLACVLCGDGLSGKRLAAFETLLRELENTRSWRERDQQFERLRTRQSQLEGEIEHARIDQKQKNKASSLAVLDAKIQGRGQRLVRLQKSIRQLESQLAAQRAAADHAHRAKSLRNRIDTIQRQVQRLVLVLQDLRLRSRRLRDQLGTQSAPPQTRTKPSEKKRRWQLKKYEKMMRCQTVLSEQLATLLSRRQRVQSRIDTLQQNTSSDADHGTLSKRLHRLQRREVACRNELKMLEAKRAAHNTMSKHPERLVTNDHVSRLESELAKVRSKLARWALDEQREADALLARLRTFFAERRNPLVLNEAAGLLRQLSDGALIGIRAGNHGRELFVEHADGRSVSCDVLSRGERVQVQLSLCLAAAASATTRGANFPLILNDVTRHLEPARLRSVVEILRNHARAAGQVILLTSQPHVATLCRSLGASSYCLDKLPEPVPMTATAPHLADDPIREKTWDCEEFPGELRDRIRLANQRLDAQWAPPPTFEKSATSSSGTNGTAHALMGADEETVDDGCPEETLRASGHYLELSDRVTEIPFLAPHLSRALEGEGIYTVANLLHVDSCQLATRLADPGITATVIAEWQSQAALMCRVRRLRAYDARILSACGITTAEQLADIRPHELYNMIQAFVATPQGSRVVRSGADHEVARLTQWIRSLQRTRQTSASHEFVSHGSNGETNQTPSASEPKSTSRVRRPKKQISNQPKQKSPKPKVAKQRPAVVNGQANADVIPLRFHLDVTSHVEAAPAIGPSMAKRLEKIGIRTVGELLTATPEEISQGLKNHRVSATTVRQWQRQASLVCRVPELRGHDAQILVACGVESPERLATFRPADLAELVLPFMKTKQGRRLLRNGKEPDADEIMHWIQWSRHARHLAAA